MRKFHFRFETVERVRREKEREAMRALAGAQQSLRDAIEAKSSLERDLAESLARREALGSEPVAADAFALEEAYITGTKQGIGRAERAIARARKELTKRIEEYLRARRRTKAMEKLRERDLASYRHERAKAERKELDDVYVMRARFKGELA